MSDRDTAGDIRKERNDNPGLAAFFGGERFIAVQEDDRSWAVLDRRYRQQVGSASEDHELTERRAAALNAANARLRAEGRRLTRTERDAIDASVIGPGDLSR